MKADLSIAASYLLGIALDGSDVMLVHGDGRAWPPAPSWRRAWEHWLGEIRPNGRIDWSVVLNNCQIVSKADKQPVNATDLVFLQEWLRNVFPQEPGPLPPGMRWAFQACTYKSALICLTFVDRISRAPTARATRDEELFGLD